MKCLTFFLLILCISCQNNNKFVQLKHIESKIDSLDSEDGAEEFINSIDPSYSDFQLTAISEVLTTDQHRFDSLIQTMAAIHKINKSYYKYDFDGNGFTDILAIGKHDHNWFDTFVILNYGRDSTNIKSLMRSHMWPIVPEIKNINGSPIIISHQPQLNRDEHPFKFFSVSTPLIYKFDFFIEYNEVPSKHTIEKIEFATDPCYGTCPIFQINIDQNRKASFIAQFYNFDDERYVTKEEGYFTTRISEFDFKQINDLLNYLDFEHLNSNYSVTWTDSAGATLIITYDGGKVKEIHDYGQIGTYGLIALYEKFKDLRFNQKWIPAKEPKGIRINNYY